MTTQQTQIAPKYLVNCQDGANNLERATIAFILATTASKTHETAMFITADAADLFVRGAMDGLAAEGHEPIANLVTQYQGNNGQIWICPVCLKTKGIAEQDLIEGVEVAGAPRTMEYLATGGMMLA
ncbi:MULTISPECIES: DsrE family protein [Marinobacter]|uniref:DsrE family protein n=1 Tax=Marinobacter suaedae TaxID=3057675 RepID=A0ABT8W0Y6_9GAMM|nr:MULTISPECIES: DsrE family protein [unclassified Marinobacter]MBZ2169929.1 DsrE family protein [Marinobacter sp. F4216]MDO3721909.1 DsrE family protein [Marinobacter sp. chi1]